MFEACTRDWLRLTGQRIDQLIISILDGAVFKALLQRNSQHLTKRGKIIYFFKIGTDLLVSKLLDDYYAFKSSF